MASACSVTPSARQEPSPYDARADIERFLSTEDPAEETAILKRLKESQISHATIKGLLRESAVGRGGPPGLYRGVPVKHMGKTLTYSLYVPDSANQPAIHKPNPTPTTKSTTILLC